MHHNDTLGVYQPCTVSGAAFMHHDDKRPLCIPVILSLKVELIGRIGLYNTSFLNNAHLLIYFLKVPFCTRVD